MILTEKDKQYLTGYVKSHKSEPKENKDLSCWLILFIFITIILSFLAYAENKSESRHPKLLHVTIPHNIPKGQSMPYSLD